MVNTDFFQNDDIDGIDGIDSVDDIDDAAPYRTFGLGQAGKHQGRVSIRREHR